MRGTSLLALNMEEQAASQEPQAPLKLAKARGSLSLGASRTSPPCPQLDLSPVRPMLDL